MECQTRAGVVAGECALLLMLIQSKQLHSFTSSPGCSQFDITWIVIQFLESVGLVKNVRVPTEAQKDKLRIRKAVAIA